MHSHRLLAGLAAAVVLSGVAAVNAHGTGGVVETSGTAPTRPAGTPRPATPRALFADRLLVYADTAFTPAQVRAVGRATGGAVAAVDLVEQDVASGDPAYPDIPVLAMVTDPAGYAAAVGDPALARALARGAVLAATEARLRRLAVGGTLRFTDGRRVPVTAVVDDHVLGGNEVSLPAAVARRQASGIDYLLVADGGHPAATATAVHRALPSIRLRAVTSTANGYLSSADRVLTQLQVKARYGEFALRRTGATTFVPDPAWVARNLVTTRVPQLGTVTCHRAVLPALTRAMVEITRRGLGATVHTADFQLQGGCWNPSVVPGQSGTISRHSWGIAVDINVDVNPFGHAPRQDPRLVAVLARQGFTWGGHWLTPDGMHFEAVATAR